MSARKEVGTACFSHSGVAAFNNSPFVQSLRAQAVLEAEAGDISKGGGFLKTLGKVAGKQLKKYGKDLLPLLKKMKDKYGKELAEMTKEESEAILKEIAGMTEEAADALVKKKLKERQE